VNGPDHPLDGMLGGYCRGLVPRVSLATGYGPTNLDITQFPPVANGWGIKYSIPDMIPPLLAKGGTTNLKELNPGTICTGPFCPT
jgi:hypothetical protein